MARISFSALSFLRQELSGRDVGCSNARLDVPQGTTIAQLVDMLGLADSEVEAAFLNGRVVPMDSELADGDRVALVPPGTPGPHRALLGMTKVRRAT